MILLYSTSQQEKHHIVVLLQRYTLDPVVIPQTEAEIVELARKHKPQTVLMFMPGQAGAAVEIQAYLREFLPHSKIRILPSEPRTQKLLPGWENVVAKAFHVRGFSKRKTVHS